MSNVFEMVTYTITFIVYVFSLFSSIRINSGTICAICLALAIFLVVLNRGKIKIQTIYLKWLFNILCIFTYVFISHQGSHAINTMLLVMVLANIAITSVYDKFNTDSIVRIAGSVSAVSIIIVLLEIVLRGPMLNVISHVASQSFADAERTRVMAGQGYRGLAEYPNVLSIASALLLFYSLWYCDADNKIKKYSYFSLAVLGIVITGERSNIVLIPAATAVVYFFSGNKQRAIRLFRTIATLIVSAVFVLLMRNFLSQYRFFERIFNLINLYISGGSVLGGRQVLNSTALKLWSQKPIFGNGWFYFFYSNRGILHGGSYSHAHNFVFELLCDTGVVGLILAVIPIITSLIDNIKIVNDQKNQSISLFKLTLAVQVLFIMDSMFHVTFYNLNMIGLYFINLMAFYSGKLQNMRRIK